MSAPGGSSAGRPTLRTYAFIDRMQPQCAAHIAATSPGDVLARYLQRTVVTYPHALLITPVGIARSAPPGRTRT